MNALNLNSILQITDSNSKLLPYLSELVPSDKKLLYKTIQQKRPNSKNYEDSWGYIIQATRYGGFKWYDPHTSSLIFFGRKSETDPTLIVATFFAEFEYLTYVISRVQKALNISKTILKNINPEDVANLTPYGFRLYKDDESWSPEARFDDQTYPQRVVDLQILQKAEGRKYRNLRAAIRKSSHYRIRKYRETDLANVLNIFALHDGITQKSKKQSKDMYFASHSMYPSANIPKFVIVDIRTDRILGFTATSQISSITEAIVVSLFDPSEKVASVWGIYQTLMISLSAGYKLVNLGGSETKGSHNFIRGTFRPVEQLGKVHVVYET